MGIPVKCSNCGDIIESRFRHDFVRCSCGQTFVDGGNDYLRYGWSGEVEPIVMGKEVPPEHIKE